MGKFWNWVEDKFSGAVRAFDPETSKQAAKKDRRSARAKVYEALLDDHLKGSGVGLNGHEIAAVTGLKLNTVTPRLAELRRANLIKDSGLRHQHQIVWTVNLNE